MSNIEFAEVLNKLYYNLVNEIDNHRNGALDSSTSQLADAVKAAVKDTHNEYCKPSDRF